MPLNFIAGYPKWVAQDVDAHETNSDALDAIKEDFESLHGVRSVTTGSTLTVADHLVKGNVTGGGFTTVLPDPTTCPGHVFILKRMDASGNTWTIDSAGSGTFDGSATITMAAGPYVEHWMSDGTNYTCVGKGSV